MGIADADSSEHQTRSKNLIIAPVACPVLDRRNGAPKLSGPCRLRIQPGSRLAAIYRANEIEEEYFCNFEVNPDYIQEFSRAGMRLSASGEQSELRAVELPDHSFFIATLFQPQLSSTELWPHPLIVEYLAMSARK